MLRKDEERWQGELRSLRIELDKEKSEKLTMRKMIDLRSKVDRGRREFEVENERSCSLKERVNRLERAMMKSERKIDEQRTIIDGCDVCFVCGVGVGVFFRWASSNLHDSRWFSHKTAAFFTE